MRRSRAGRFPGRPFLDGGGHLDLKGPRRFRGGYDDMLIRLLEIPCTLEHDTVTDPLLAVLRLKEELQQRGSLSWLPESDLRHLAGDIRRA